MDSGSQVADARTVFKLDVNSIIQVLLCFWIVFWGGVQLHFQFSPDAASWAGELPESLSINLNYLVFWLRLLPGMMVLYAGFYFLSGRLALGAVYSGIFLLHLCAVLASDRMQVVRGLAAAAGL